MFRVDPVLLLATTLALPAATATATPPGGSIPPADSMALAVLDTSPRDGEDVTVALDSGAPMKTWVVYPERKDKAGVVVLIMEIYGLSPWLRSVADQLAKDGFIAVAPDLVAGLGPGGGGTDSAATRDDVVKMVRALTPEEALARIEATRKFAASIPAANGTVATMGFCWGGGRSFEFAAHDPPPQAAIVYYGVSPDSATLLKVRAPVLGFYGGDDARVNATIDPAKAALKQSKRWYEPHIYEGAGHGFLRAQTMREGANLKAAQQSWPVAIAFLKKQLK